MREPGRTRSKVVRRAREGNIISRRGTRRASKGTGGKRSRRRGGRRGRERKGG